MVSPNYATSNEFEDFYILCEKALAVLMCSQMDFKLTLLKKALSQWLQWYGFYQMDVIICVRRWGLCEKALSQ